LEGTGVGVIVPISPDSKIQFRIQHLEQLKPWEPLRRLNKMAW